MAKPTIEELQAELQNVATKHNEALKIIEQCKTRFIQLSAIIADRQEEE